MQYSKRVKAYVYGRLLEAFDKFCVYKSMNESEGVRECVSAYLSQIKDSEIRTKFPPPNGFGDKNFGRKLEARFGGKLLKDFAHICESRLMSEAEVLREAIRIATNYGNNDRGIRFTVDNNGGRERLRNTG